MTICRKKIHEQFSLKYPNVKYFYRLSLSPADINSVKYYTPKVITQESNYKITLKKRTLTQRNE